MSPRSCDLRCLTWRLTAGTSCKTYQSKSAIYLFCCFQNKVTETGQVRYFLFLTHTDQVTRRKGEWHHQIVQTKSCETNQIEAVKSISQSCASRQVQPEFLHLHHHACGVMTSRWGHSTTVLCLYLQQVFSSGLAVTSLVMWALRHRWVLIWDGDIGITLICVLGLVDGGYYESVGGL